MSALQSFLDQWQRCQSDLQTMDLGNEDKQFEPVNVHHESRTLTSTEAVSILPELAEKEGWMQWPSQVICLPAALASNQFPLKAEVHQGDTSWQLSYTQNDQWLLTKIRITPCAIEDATHLAETVLHTSTLNDVNHLIYKKLWFMDETIPPTCTLAAFTGFKD
jgi:hypothetical protein